MGVQAGAPLSRVWGQGALMATAAELGVLTGPASLSISDDSAAEDGDPSPPHVLSPMF